ncbi:MAG: hypothetical protein WAT42_07335 [Candidatus Nanopelagicales bacterium]|nr:hypothetical protein [Candidatus Nanopelagicales bacterium]
MTTSKHLGQWQIQPREGEVHMKTSRVGLFSISATAPIVGGEADWTTAEADLVIQIGLNEMKTGNSLLDPEVQKLINRGSDGMLTFKGSGHAHDDEVRFEGTATAGNVVVPMILLGEAEEESETQREVKVSGTATFDDLHLPLPGLSHVRKIDLHIEAMLRLLRQR